MRPRSSRIFCAPAAKGVAPALVALALAALALVVFSSPARAWFTSPLKSYPVYHETLPNGMTVVLQEVHTRPLVSVNLFVRVGGCQDSDFKDGMAHFYEHVFFRGTPTRSGMEMKRDLEALGGQANGETNKDFTRFYVDLPSIHAQEAIEILGDALMHPAFNPKDIDQEREVVQNEVGLNQQSPSSLLLRLLFSTAYQRHPYRNSVIGDQQSVGAVTRQDFLDFKRRYYTPDRVVLVVVGDFRLNSMRKFIRSYFQNFNAEASAPDQFLPEAPQTGVRKVVQNLEMGSVFMALGYHVAGLSRPSDVVAQDVLTFMLGQGEGSLLNRDLVTEGNLAWGAGADYLTQKYPGLFIITINASPDKADEARAAALHVVSRVVKGDFSDQDLNRAKNYLAHVYLLGDETDQGKAAELGNYAALGSLDFAESYLDQVGAVTREDVIRVARAYLGDNYTLVELRPPEKSQGPGKAGGAPPPAGMPWGGGGIPLRERQGVQ